MVLADGHPSLLRYDATGPPTHGFGATGEVGAPENGENVSVQDIENQGSSGFVGLCWTFEF